MRGLLLAAAAASAPPAGAALPDLCTFAGFRFNVFHGNGSAAVAPPNATAPCAVLTMRSTDAAAGAAASFDSPPFPVRALGVYNVSLDFATHALVPLSAYLTGGFYVSYADARGVASGWAPAYGSLAPADSRGFFAAALSFTAPSTAAVAVLHVTFAAHEFGYAPNRMQGGAATGAVTVVGRAGALVDTGETRAAPPPPVRVPAAQEPALARLLGLAAQCLFNSQLGGNFTVGSDYDISGNMSPDMMWGAFGVRRAGVPAFAETMRAQWEDFGGLFDATGRLGSQERFMAQVLFPLGVDELFSFSGNATWLRRWLPVADASFAYLASISDARGLSTC